MRREANLLDKAPQPVEPNVWLARSDALVVPFTSREAKDEAFENVRTFLSRLSGGGDEKKLSTEDVFPFKSIAASDGVDSYYTAQDVDTSLKPMAKDFAAGRSVLGNHDYGTFSYGSTTSGKVVDAERDAPEYEAAFYDDVLKGKPSLATSKWLVTDGYIVRGMNDMGSQASSDSLIRGMEFGGIRRVSISFTVGGYRCGIDGQDMIAGWFGDPEPIGYYVDDEDACMHFPGIDYGSEGMAYASMEHNRALEESMVYMNSSPSAMLMRKAEVLAARGVLTAAQRSQVEQRFGMRLPRFDKRMYVAAKPDESTEVVMERQIGDTVRWAGEDGVELEGTISAIAENGTLTVDREIEPGTTEQVEVAAEQVIDGADAAADEADAAAAEAAGAVADAGDAAADAGEVPDTGPDIGGEAGSAAVDDGEARATVASPTSEEEFSAHLAADAPDGHDTAADGSSLEALREQHSELHGSETAAAGHSHGTPTKEEAAPPEAAGVPVGAVESEVDAEAVVAEYVIASQRVAALVARAPEAFGSAETSAIYAAERSIEQTLVDLGTERSVGGDVARQHATRDKILRDVLGRDLTVEGIRTVMAEAADGRLAKDELVRDTVAARVGVHGEHFDAKAYENMLRTQDMATIRSEKDSWDDAKRQRFTAGRSVVPRDIKDGKIEKRAPARPAKEPGKETVASEPQTNLLAGR